MAESKSHKEAKNKAAGPGGKTEVPLSGNRRLDALTKNATKATEVERSGDPAQLAKAVRRLDASGAGKKVLKVPQPDMDTAAAAMRKAGVSGKVENITGDEESRRTPNKKITGWVEKGLLETTYVCNDFLNLRGRNGERNEAARFYQL